MMILRSGEIQITIPADLRYLNVVGSAVHAYLERTDGVEDEHIEDIVYNIQLAVHEVCTNIIEHAYQFDARKPVQLSFYVSRSENRLEVVLRDQGRKFDPSAVAAPELGTAQERGLGLFLVYELMDSVDYFHDGIWNRWTLVKKLP
ncbi:MAG: ATP-binding protein [Anaerolineae bacterium]|nr:ATP-binding protein [Anaerolineae bacterium]